MTRVLACLAIGAWVFLLWPFPITTFMATCMACVTYPAYRKLHRKMSPSWAMTTYTVGLAAITILPIATVVSLVTPQAVAGLKILDGLRDSGWIHSPEAQAWFASVDAWLKNLPGLEGGLDQLASTAAGLAGTAAPAGLLRAGINVDAADPACGGEGERHRRAVLGEKRAVFGDASGLQDERIAAGL